MVISCAWLSTWACTCLYPPNEYARQQVVEAATKEEQACRLGSGWVGSLAWLGMCRTISPCSTWYRQGSTVILDPAVHGRCRYNCRIQSDTWYVIVDPLCEYRGVWCHASRCEMPSCLTWVESYSAVLHGGHSVATSGECNLKMYERS